MGRERKPIQINSSEHGERSIPARGDQENFQKVHSPRGEWITIPLVPGEGKEEIVPQHHNEKKGGGLH